jgi:hypothetical protein
MTNMHSNFSQDEHRLLDLLVDDELGDDRRRELLARIEASPDGWRQCALAFLESQAWRRSLRRAAREASSPGCEADRATPVRSSYRPARHWMGTVLAMAASFLAAFALALTWRGVPGQPGASRPVDLAASSPRSGDRAETPVGPVDTAVPGASELQMVTLSVDGAEGKQSIEVPVIPADRYDPNWLGDQPSAVPAEVLRALRQSGHRVDQRRNLVPVEMQDGSRLFVPVDQFDVRYMGDPYQ